MLWHNFSEKVKRTINKNLIRMYLKKRKKKKKEKKEKEVI